MNILSARSALRTVALGLAGAASLLALAGQANAACTPTAGDDVCDVNSAANPPANANFAANGNDKLVLSGATNFAFDLAQVGAGLLGLDAFEKEGASEVTLTGAPVGANAANQWLVKAGALIAGAGANFQNTAEVSVQAGARFIVRTTDETISKLTNLGTVLVEGGQRLIVTSNTAVNNPVNASITGPFTLGGDLINNGVVNGEGSAANRSTIAGNATNNFGGILGGNLDIAGALTNAGTLRPGASPGTMTVAGDFNGGGTVDVEVAFNNISAPVNGTTHDFLSIGGAATGQTGINIVAFAPFDNPDPASGNGVELVRIAGNSASGAFRLVGGPVFQGGFQYLLERVGANNAPASYFLQSVVREELYANAVALAASRSTVRALAFSDRGVEAAEGIGAKIRSWLTVHGGREHAGFESGTRFNSDFWGVTAGIDSGFTSNLRVGIQGGYGQTNADIFLRQGSPALDGETWFAQIYGQFVSGRWFGDASVGYASTDWEMRRAVAAGRVSETVDGMIGKIGGGYRWQFDEPFSITTSAHVLYDGTSCGDNCFLVGVREDTSDWAGRIAVRFERPFDDGKIRPYLNVSVTNDFDGGQRASFGQARAVSDIHGGVLGLNAGVAMDIAPNMHVFLDAGMTQSMDNDVKGYQGQAGFRMTW